MTLTGGTGAAHLAVSGSTLYLVIDSLVLLAPVPGYSTLNVTVTANGTADGFSINSTNSQSAQLAGTQPLGLAANFDSVAQQGTVTGLEFFDGDIQVTNTVNWTLNLGLLGMYATGSNLVSQLYTPHPLSLVSGGTNFALADHELILDGGTLDVWATGLAALDMSPSTNNLAATPIQGPVAASGNGTVTLSSPTVVGSTASYTVTVTIPVNLSYLLRPPRWTSPSRSPDQALAGDAHAVIGPGHEPGIMATGPASFKVSGLGGASQTYGIYASTNLAAPMTNWWLIGATNADASGVIQFLDTRLRTSSGSTGSHNNGFLRIPRLNPRIARGHPDACARLCPRPITKRL